MPALAQKSAELIFANGSNSNQVEIKRRAFNAKECVVTRQLFELSKFKYIIIPIYKNKILKSCTKNLKMKCLS